MAVKSKAVDVYRQLALLPSLSRAKFVSGGGGGGVISVEADLNQVDLERSAKSSYRKTYHLSSESLTLVVASQPHEVNNEQCNVISPDGSYRFIVRKVSSSTIKEEKQFIEIWTKQHKLLNIDVGAEELHGDVYTGQGMLGNVRWCRDEGRVVFIAERCVPKSLSHFDKKLEEKMGKDQKLTVGEEYEYKDSWGEQLVTCQRSVICVLEIKTGLVTVFGDGVLPPNIFPAQVEWTQEGNVLFVGMQDTPYKLGAIYCPNRPSQIYHLDISSKTCEGVFARGKSVRSVRVSPDGSRLVYLENDTFGPHARGSRLHVCDWNEKTDRIVVGLVDRPLSDTGFPGIYTLSLPPSCWLSDGKGLVMHGVWGSSQLPILVDTDTGEIRKLCNETNKVGCFTILDVRDDLVLASRSTPSAPASLMIYSISRDRWQLLDDHHTLGKEMSDRVDWRVISLSPTSHNENVKYSGLKYEAILLKPTHGENVPLIVWPHGGPHSVFTADYSLYLSGLVLLGYAVLLVNYRGSYGFGEDSLNSLPGNIGSQDVRDVQDCCEQVLASHPALDGERVYCCGGSHGGFIIAHLIAQYPHFYRAGLARNPVTNLASKIGVSDIPDWAYVEAGLDFRYDLLPNAQSYEKMWACSPLKHVDKVTTPLLLMLGSDDLRVHPSQGIDYYRALKARDREVRLLWYPNNSHPLDKLPVVADGFVQIYEWLEKHK